MFSRKFFTLLFFNFLIAITSLDARTIRCSREPWHEANRQRDFEAVQEFVNSKRTITLDEKEKEFKISGDIRTEFYYRAEKINGQAVRGLFHPFAVDSRCIPIPHDEIQIILNTQFDYKCGRSWGQALIKYDESAGIQVAKNSCRGRGSDPNIFGSGICDDVCVKRAFWGYRVVDCKKDTLDLEVGRRQMYKVFDSRIEFNARMDGVVLKYNHVFKPDWAVYWTGGGFLIDERIDDFGWATEVGALDFFETGYDFKYSYIDWGKPFNRCGTSDPFGAKFKVSQVSFAYNHKPKIGGKKFRVYGAFLINTAATHATYNTFPIIVPVDCVPTVLVPAQSYTFTHKQNMGGYLGFIIGEVKKKGDWSFDVNYQVVQAQAIPDMDVHGIGRGNAVKGTTTANLMGKSNFKGWHFEGLYAVTDHFQLDGTFEISHAQNADAGARVKFYKAELDVILQF